MVYVPTVFRNGQAPAYDSAEELNKVQQGILDAHNMAEKVFGTYTGTDEATRSINVGFLPRAVLIMPIDLKRMLSSNNWVVGLPSGGGFTNSSFNDGKTYIQQFGGMFFGGESLVYDPGTTSTTGATIANIVTLNSTGFTVKNETINNAVLELSVRLNVTTNRYKYVAFK